MDKFQNSDGIAISCDTVVVAAENQVSTEVGGEVAILNLDTGVYYGLNQVGAHVWGLISEPRTVRRIREDVCAEYDVQPDRCCEDLRGFLTRLIDAALVEVCNEHPEQVS
ncbi:MAG: PqqD family protein [Desulfomonilaceae bacterium]|nr:PqqD family protein [Desulfomonilaceae bacterium]